MELQHLRVLVALADAGSMTAAAERLGVSQPAISFSLGQFERELGYTLFHRSRGGLMLTERGQSLVALARAVLKQTEAIVASGKESGSEGIVRIAGRQGFMQYVFPQLLGRLRKRLPAIEIELALSGDNDEVVDALRGGIVDLAFAAAPSVKSIVHEVFHHDPVLLAVSQRHPIARHGKLSLKQLSTLTFCLPSRSDRLRAAIDKFLRTLPARPKVLLESNDYTLMRNVIESGEAAGFIYGHMLSRTEDRKRLLPIKVESLTLYRDLTVLHRRDDLLPHVRLTREVLLEESRNLLGLVNEQLQLDSERVRRSAS